MQKEAGMPCYSFYAGNYRLLVYNSNNYSNYSMKLSDYEYIAINIFKENIYNEEPIDSIHPNYNEVWMNFFNSIRWTSDEITFRLMKNMDINTFYKIIKFCCYISELSVFE